MPAAHGLRSRTRDLLATGLRKHGTLPLTTYLRTFKIGDYVHSKIKGMVQEGMPHDFHHGSTGRAWNVTKRATGVEFNKQSKEFGTKTGFLMPFKNTGISQVAKPFFGPTQCFSQLGNSMSTKRCFSMMGNSGESVPQEGFVAMSDVPKRIKFKRLDKTSRHIMQILDKEAVDEVKSKREIPDIRPGYFVQLRVEVPENKRRVSTVKGVVIARRNAGLNTTFRLRRSEAGVGFESLYPLYSPNIKEIKILDKKKVRRAKLYYLRDKMNAMTALKKKKK